MRNKVLIFVLSGAVISGLIAAVSVSRYLAELRGAGNLGSVVVAKTEIPAGVKIVAEQLTTVRLPRSAMPEGAYDSHEKVVGRVATERIAKRELAPGFNLAPDGAPAGLSALIPEGYGGMTVKVDDEGRSRDSWRLALWLTFWPSSTRLTTAQVRTRFRRSFFRTSR